MPEKKTTEKVTVKCIYCGRMIDGYFVGGHEQVVNGHAETLAIPGSYENRKGFLHTACKTGVDAIAEMEVKNEK